MDPTKAPKNSLSRWIQRRKSRFGVSMSVERVVARGQG